MKYLRIAAIGTRGLPSSYSGIERSCEALYSALAARGHRVTVYSRADPNSGARGDESYRGIRLVEVRAIRRRSIETLSHSAASLYHAIRLEDYDVVEFHALAPCVFIQMANRAGVATVAKIHGLDWQRAKWNRLGSAVLRFGEIQAAENAHQIAVVSRDLLDYFRDRYRRTTTFVPNGMPDVRERFVIDRKVLSGLDVAEGGYVLFFGRLVPEKRVEDLIQAYSGVDTQLKLLVAGTGGYTDEYVDSLKRTAATDSRVRFVGHLDGPVLEHVVRGAGLAVFPSELEGLPMALLEAIAYGTPVLASDIPPHRQLVGGSDDRGMLFRSGDVAALRGLIARAVGETAKRRQHAEALRSQLQDEYSWPLIADRMEAVYRRALVSAGRQPSHYSATTQH